MPTNKNSKEQSATPISKKQERPIVKSHGVDWDQVRTEALTHLALGGSRRGVRIGGGH